MNEEMDAMDDEVEQRLMTIISQQMGVDKSEITRGMRFREDLGTDSLDEVVLVMEAEDEFEIGISDEEAEMILTVGDAIDYVRRHSATA